MEGHENSASRLYDFVQAMLRQPTQKRQSSVVMQSVVLEAFGLDPTHFTSRETTFWIMRVLELLYAEYDALELALKSSGKTARSYSAITAAFQDHLHIHGMFQSWEQAQSKFQRAGDALLIFAEFFPDDGEKLDVRELETIKQQVQELRNQVSASVLPEYVKQFVYEQLRIITEGIEDYPIAGAKAFKVAIRKAAMHDIDHSDEVREYEKTEEVTKLKELQAAICKYSKYTIEFSKFVAACTLIGSTAPNTILAATPYVAAIGEKVQHLLNR